MNRLLERSGVVAIFIITSLSFAILVYDHLTTGLVDYNLPFLSIASLCIIYLLAFLSALVLSWFS